MTDRHPQPLVAVVNTSEEITRLLCSVLEDEGYRTVSVYVPDLKRGTPAWSDFLADQQPDVLVWDIAIPYEENWRFFQQVQATPGTARCHIVLTTTNQRALAALVGETGAHEIIGKPYDLDDILRAVAQRPG